MLITKIKFNVPFIVLPDKGLWTDLEPGDIEVLVEDV